MSWTHRWFGGLLVAVVVFAVGCGSSRPETIPAQGRVTFAGGPPPAPGSLIFAPLEAAEGYTLRPGFGGFNAEGEVTVTSFKTGDGLVPGRYEVKVECWRVAPTEETPGESYVPAAYQPTELVVSPTSKRVEFTIDVP